jgi:hypothetical protein
VPDGPPLDELTVEDFAPLVNDRFRVVPDGSPPLEVELVEVEAIPREPGGRVPFSLVFRGGPSPPLPQAIYRIEHDGLGAIDVFLVPIAIDSYQAVFS